MNQEKLNVIVEFNKTKKTQECPIIIDRIDWGYLTDNILYGSFHHPDFKYLNINVSHEYRYKRNWMIVDCEPYIYEKSEDDQFISLLEHDIHKYFSHEDYWNAQILFEQPNNCNIYAKEVNCLKWQHDFFAVYFPIKITDNSTYFLEKYKAMKQSINIGYIYDKKTNEAELIHNEYSEVVNDMLNELREINDNKLKE